MAVRIQTRPEPSWELKVPEYFNFATDVIDRWAETQPDALGLWCVNAALGAEQKFTFQQLSRLSAQAANVFRSAGVRRGDRALIMMPRVPQWWIAMLGLIRLGAVPVPGTLQLTPRDVAYRIQAAKITAVIANADGVAKLDGFDGMRLAVGEAPSGWGDFDAQLRVADTRLQAEPTRSDDPGIIYFTSATAGDPKMVLHTQASYGLGHRLTGELWLDCKPGEVHWNISTLAGARPRGRVFMGRGRWAPACSHWMSGASLIPHRR